MIKPLDSAKRVVCIGDLHGNLDQVRQLWTKLQEKIGGEELKQNTAVVFLGDFCDRGPRTKDTLDWLVELKRQYPRIYFIAGNHDFGMASFLGLIPARPSSFESALTLDATRDPTYQSGFWTHDVPGGMHYQGRRWGFSPADIYDTANTFKSYGIEGPAEGPELREELLAAVPVAHKELLAGMHWVVELECTRFDGHDPLKIVCVHAGLSADKDAAAQLEALRLRDWRMPVLHERGQVARIEAFSGRTTVLRNHPALVEGNVVLVSGHHGTCIIDRSDQRAIVDEHGGLGPIQAIIFPEWEVISS